MTTLQRSSTEPVPWAHLPDLVNEETLWLKNFISTQTQRAYSLAFREFCGFLNISTPEAFRSVTAAHIVSYRDFLLGEKGMKHRSVRNRMAALSSCYRFLQHRGVVNRNPVEGIERPKVDESRGETPVMTAQQVRRILNEPDITTLKGARDSAILHLLLYMGARIGAPRSIRIEDFFEDKGFYVLRWKNKGGENHVEPVPPPMQHALLRYLSLREESDNPKAPLFARVKARRGTNAPLGIKTFSNIWELYREKAGLPAQFTPHSARATFATTADEAGVPIQDIQRTLGHKRVSTTETYVHSRRDYKDSAVWAVKY